MAVIYPVSPSGSLLSLIVERLRRLRMSDWVKIGLTLAGFAVITWSMVQQHEYRLEKIEHSFEAHLQAHDSQYRDIAKALRDIDIALARMNAKDGAAATR